MCRDCHELWKETTSEILGLLIAMTTDGAFLLWIGDAVNGRLVSVPYLGGDMEVRVYGTIMFESDSTFWATSSPFTPQNNEFQLQLSPKISASKTHLPCGKTVVSFFPEMYASLL